MSVLSRPTLLGLLLALLFVPASAVAFETNGKQWPEMPIDYYINPAQCPILEDDDGNPLTIVDFVAAATAAWSDIPCADISFNYLGATDATWEADGANVIYCISDPADWSFGEGSAGATLWLPRQNEEDPLEVDLALNAAQLEWRLGGGDALAGNVIDPRALITHELGHWLGMAHTPDPFATMYYATLPNAIQMTPAGDDKAGVCSLYPSGEKECLSDEDCPEDCVCDSIQGIPVCQELHDSIGGFCSKDHINCENMCWVSFFECEQLCLFTTLDYSEGYCSPLCDPDHDNCPDGYLCTEVPEHGIAVCMIDPDYVPPEPDPELQDAVVAEYADEADVTTPPEAGWEVIGPDTNLEPDLAALPEATTGEPAPDIAGPPDAADTSDSDGGGCRAAPRSSTASLVLLLAALLALAAFRRTRA